MRCNVKDISTITRGDTFYLRITRINSLNSKDNETKNRQYYGMFAVKFAALSADAPDGLGARVPSAIERAYLRTRGENG